MFILAGFLVIIFDVTIINWILTRELGLPVWVGIFSLGTMLIIYSSSLASIGAPIITPPVLPKAFADQVEKWEASGDLATVVENLSQGDTLTLFNFMKTHFGEYVAKTSTTPKGKIMTLKLLRVGYQILPAGSDEGRLFFRVILYRRDLATQKGIRRPWRTISRRDTAYQLVEPGPLVELPNWFAG